MTNLFNYIDRPSPIHKLTGASKLFGLILWSLGAMSGFHTPFLAVLTVGGVTAAAVHIRDLEKIDEKKGENR